MRTLPILALFLIGLVVIPSYAATTITDQQITTPQITVSNSLSAVAKSLTLTNGLNISLDTEVMYVNKSATFGNNVKYILLNGSDWSIMGRSDDGCGLINTGFAAMSKFGGFINVKSGNYTCRTTILATAGNEGILGQGDCTAVQHGCSSFVMSNPGISQMFNTNGKGNFMLRDIYFNGNNTGLNSSGCIVMGGDNSRALFVGVNFCNGIGMFISASHAGFFSNVYSESNAKSGFQITNSWSDVFIDTYTATNTQFGYYCLTGCVNETFNGIVSQDDKQDCMVLQATGNPTTADYNNILGLQCKSVTARTAQHGIRLLGAQHNNIIAPLITGAGSNTANTYDGIQLALQGSRCSCYNNIADAQITSPTIFTNHMRYGINEADTSEGWNTYHNSQITGAVTSNYRVQNVTSIGWMNVLGNWGNKGLAMTIGNNTIQMNPIVNATTDLGACTATQHILVTYFNTANNTLRSCYNSGGIIHVMRGGN